MPELKLDLPLTDLRPLPEAEREAEAAHLADEAAQRPFNLARGPLVRAQLLWLADDEYAIVLVMHHIISDEWSMNVLMSELLAIYPAFAAGKPTPLPELPLQYPDFAVWQRGWLQGEVLETQLAYWREHLAGAPPLLELPTDRPRPPMQTFAGSYETFTISRRLSYALQALGQREGATLFMVVLAAFKVLLARYSGQDDICVGTPIANCTRAEIEPMIGFFVNTLVIRSRLADNPSFLDLLRKVREPL